MAKDWEGRNVPDDEPADKVIKVWQVTPHVGDSHFDSYVERGWQDMLAYLNSSLEGWLERVEPDDLAEGVTLTFKLVDMTVGAYREMIAD